MKRILRILALVVATSYGMFFLLHVCFYPKEDVPAEIGLRQFSCATARFISTWRGVRDRFQTSPTLESLKL
jgi:hypothetical protein